MASSSVNLFVRLFIIVYSGYYMPVKQDKKRKFYLLGLADGLARLGDDRRLFILRPDPI